MQEVKIERPPRIKLSAKESLKRTSEFDKRKNCEIISKYADKLKEAVFVALEEDVILVTAMKTSHAN